MTRAETPARTRARALGTGETREKILRCATRLFAREGIDRVTLRQIGRAAGQRNVAAVQYHFGGKDRLVREIVDRHQEQVDQTRSQRLDALPVEADRLAPLLRILVEPLADLLDDALGRAYLQIQTQRRDTDVLRPATRELVGRIRTVLGARPARPLHDRFAFLLLFGALADRARAEASTKPSRESRGAFVAALTSALEGLYTGPIRVG